MFVPQAYLLVIDDVPLDAQVVDYFRQFSYAIIQHPSFEFELFNKQQPVAAWLINWRFVRENIKIIERLYQQYFVPLVIYHDHLDEDTCIRALEAGADDFVLKTIHPRELHARINAISRRFKKSSRRDQSEKEVIRFASWSLYPASRQLFASDNQELQLSISEYELLFAFIRQPQCILEREFLLHTTKTHDPKFSDRRIDVLISRLRQKIELDAKKPMLIKTIRNRGYLFTAPVFSTHAGK